MKKMIAILVLCAFVSVSSAAIMFQTAKSEVQYGETFTVNVVADGDTATIAFTATVAGNGTTATWANNKLAAGYFAVTSLPGTIQDGTKSNIAVYKVAGTNSTGVFVPAGAVLFSFDVTAGATSGVITIDDFAGTSPYGGPSLSSKWNAVTTTMDPLSVNVVPEPMTMALLGLGGLFIRRRRA